MTWRHHRITTVAIMYALTGSIPASLVSVAGSALPDQLAFNRTAGHRTYTHYPYGYLVAIISVWVAYHISPRYPLYFVLYLLAGAICHLATDILSKSGIPLKSPKGKPYGFGMYKLGDINEALVAWGIFISFLMIAGTLGYFTPAYLSASANSFIRFVAGVFS